MKWNFPSSGKFSDAVGIKSPVPQAQIPAVRQTSHATGIKLPVPQAQIPAIRLFFAGIWTFIVFTVEGGF